jgi:acyl-coenzyme A synthetase/AMP-(fatty) acid ligase
MLACARIGAVHSVVFGGFAAAELARRIEHAEVQMYNVEISFDFGASLPVAKKEGRF